MCWFYTNVSSCACVQGATTVVRRVIYLVIAPTDSREEIVAEVVVVVAVASATTAVKAVTSLGSVPRPGREVEPEAETTRARG